MSVGNTAARPRIMGILNLTPDSFSDGGKFTDVGCAVERGLQMAREGAHIIDVGGESTRPGAQRIPAAEQIRRVLPVIRGLRAKLPSDVCISIDTSKAEVAQAALEAGAAMINDVFAGRDDAQLLPLAARAGVPLTLMHMQGEPATMQDDPHYDDVVEEVRAFLLERAAAAETAGVGRGNIYIDPGIGFGKSRQHNLQLLASLGRLVDTGYAVLLGASRKRFMGSICRAEKYDELVAATCATTALGVTAGVCLFRVHDVKENRQALDVAWAIKKAENKYKEYAKRTY